VIAQLNWAITRESVDGRVAEQAAEGKAVTVKAARGPWMEHAKPVEREAEGASGWETVERERCSGRTASGKAA
jgi:hypothetical protein